MKNLTGHITVIAWAATIVLFFGASTAKVAAQDPNVLASINFDPKVDGFGFENYTNKNRQWESDLTADDMIRFFGRKAVCIPDTTGKDCVMKAAASAWLTKQLKGMDGGHCEGMAATSLRLKFGKPFKDLSGKPVSFQPDVNLTADLKLNQIVGNYIAYYFITQMFDEVKKPTDESAKTGPVAVVNTLIKAMDDIKAAEKPKEAINETYTLGFYKYDRATGKKSDGHAITPIAVEEKDSEYRIQVYDNNYPKETRYVIVDKGGKQAWRYVTATNPNEPTAEYSGDMDTKTLELTPTSSRERNCYEAPFAAEYTQKECLATGATASINSGLNNRFLIGADEFFSINDDQSSVPATIADVAGGDRAEFFLDNSGDLLVTTPDGKRLGFDPQTNKFYEEILGGHASEIVGGRGKTIPNFTIPAHTSGGAYQITFSGKDLKEESTTDFVYSAPGLTVGFEAIKLDPKEILHTTIAPDGETITFTSSADGETPAIYFAFDPKEGSGDSYTVRVSGAQISAGKTLTAHFDFKNHKASFKDNDGNEDTYDVEVTRLKADGTHQTLKKEFKEEGKEVESNFDEWKN